MQKIKKESELTTEDKCAFDTLISLEKKKVPKLKVLEYIFMYLDDDIRGKRTGIAITYTDDRGVSRLQSEMYGFYDLKVLSRKLKLKKLR